LEHSVAANPALVVEGLHKSFGDVEVLRGVSLVAQTGDVISMLGASGSGKSTLLRCINLLEVPNSGDVTVHGETIQMTTDRRGDPAPADMKQVARIRSQLGMVFQSFNLWEHMTVMENVTEALIHVLKMKKKEARDKAESVLNKVGMYDRRDYYPAHISGGQQQRTAIARVLAMERDPGRQCRRKPSHPQRLGHMSARSQIHHPRAVQRNPGAAHLRATVRRSSSTGRHQQDAPSRRLFL
jgi:ABC-type histidine transport system ATPase subunit